MSSETPRNRSRLDVDERRAQLLRIGIDLFSHRSFDDISIDEIADAAGISKGLLYHYFTTKRDFYVEVIRSAAEELKDLVIQDPDLPPLEQLRRGLEAYFDFVEHRASGYATLLRGGIGTDDEVRAIVDGLRDAMGEQVLHGVHAADHSRPVLRHAVRGWIGFVETVSLNWLEGRDVEREELRELLALTLAAVLGVAQKVDPEAKVDLSQLADAGL